MSSSNTDKKGKGKAPAPDDTLRIGPASTVLPGELNEQGKFVCGMFKPGSDTELCGEVIANKQGSISSHKHKIHHAQYRQSKKDVQTVKTTQYEKLNAPEASSVSAAVATRTAPTALFSTIASTRRPTITMAPML
ncbi:hypothetical protein PG997_014063 [Apiospora hydei]|uniref:Uncharacterized protein n=1 Tax=Apiospora hydei TaxID=1337664 RepID=A0ABR1V7Z6_9PEZI